MALLVCLLCWSLAAKEAVNSAEIPFGATPDHVIEFGPDAGDERLPVSLDGAVGPLNASQALAFYQNTYTDIYVSPNGAISFGVALTSYLPSALPYQTYPAVFPFWADVNLWERTGDVYFRQTEQRSLLDNITRDANVAFHCHVGFNATWALIVTWHNVTFYREDFLSQPWPQTSTNTFQAVIASDLIDTFVIFNYVQIDWTAGQDSGGGAAGVGGTPALVGFNAGDNIRSYVISDTTAADMALSTNTNVTGQWVFIISDNVTGTELCDRDVCTCSVRGYSTAGGTTSPVAFGFDGTPLDLPDGYFALSKWTTVRTDPCKYDLRASIAPAPDMFLKRITFSFGVDPSIPGKFNRKLILAHNVIREVLYDTTQTDLTLPYNVTTADGLTQVTLEWESPNVFLLTSTTCPYYFRYTIDAGGWDTFLFYAGELDVDWEDGDLFRGLCGTCNRIPGD